MNKLGYISEKIDGGHLVHFDDGTTGFLTAVEFEEFKKNREELKKEENEKFNVFTYSVFDKDTKVGYVHWAEGLKMIIRKGDVTIELESDEIKKVVNALPRTLGGTYK